MKNTRFTEEQIIGFLKQAEAGMPFAAIRSTLGTGKSLSFDRY